MRTILKSSGWFQLSVSEKNLVYSSELCVSRQRIYPDFSAYINTMLQLDNSNLSCFADLSYKFFYNFHFLHSNI